MLKFQMLQRYIFSILIFLFSLVVYANELPKLSCEEILSRVDQAIDPLNKGKNIHSFEINSKTKVSRFGDFELDYQMIFKSPNLAKYYWLMPLYVLIMGMWNVLNYW